MNTANPLSRNLTLDKAIEEAEASYIAGNPKSARHSTASQASMPGGNTRTTLHFSPFPLTIARAEDCWLYDVDGHRYADFVNEYSAGLFGHNHPVIRSAIQDVLASGINLGAPNLFEADLAGKIIERFPSIQLLRFCNSGTEANLLALGTARAVTRRSKILVFTGAYHGSLFYFHHGASPINAITDVVFARYNDWPNTEKVIAQHRNELAAVIVEPMQGASGCIAGHPDFLASLRTACTEAQILLVFDEVMTSRLSAGGLQKKLGITPDLTTLGKYIGGGVALAAFGGRSDIMRRFDPRSPDTFPHGGTFNNNILAMATGLRAFEEILLPKVLDRMNGLGDGLRDRLSRFASANGLPFQATGVGSLVGIHFHPYAIERTEDLEFEPELAALADRLARLLHFDLLAAGQYIARRGYLALSLETTAEQVDVLADRIEEFLSLRRSLILAILDQPTK